MHSLRSVSNLTLQAKGLERQWLKHQTTGDLDDAKVGCWGGLVDEAVRYLVYCTMASVK